jgi:two-component sensor histidine kinase
MENPLHWLINESLSNTKDFNERSQIKMTFRIWFILSLLFIVLASIVVVFENDYGLIYPISTGLVFLVVVAYLLRSNKRKIASYLISFSGVIITLIAVFLLENPMPIDGGLWLIIFCMYAYFSLEKRTGNVLFVFSMVVYSVYLIFVLPKHLDTFDLESLQLSQQIVLVATIVSIFLIIRHLIVAFILANKEGEKHLLEVNSELSYQNTIIESQNKEKTLMMMEIHHRVKNNLQVINSLLRIQANKLQDDQSRDVFNEAQNKVIAMSLIHEEMYKNKNLDEINFMGYIHNLTKAIVANNQSDKAVDVNVDSEIEFIDNKTMVPLGLILNEMIINSLKHGFKIANNNRIDIQFIFNDKGEDEFVMHYKDNGKGFDPTEVNVENSFGLEMIDALSEQLDAQFEILSVEKGVHMTLTFIGTEENA